MEPNRLRQVNKTKDFQTFLPFCVQDYSFFFFLLVLIPYQKECYSPLELKITCKIPTKRCLFKVAFESVIKRLTGSTMGTTSMTDRYYEWTDE